MPWQPKPERPCSAYLPSSIPKGSFSRLSSAEWIYFDRQKFADSCGLPRSRVHSFEGAPHKGITEAARQLGSDILVIGCANRHLGDSGSVIGDTARRIIDAVDTDLAVIPSA
jgi:hypothetical protein